LGQSQAHVPFLKIGDRVDNPCGADIHTPHYIFDYASPEDWAEQAKMAAEITGGSGYPKDKAEDGAIFFKCSSKLVPKQLSIGGEENV
jgi:hypothetical protein